MLDRLETGIPGCWLLQPVVRGDERGRFVKVFHEPTFRDLGLASAFTEEYYSVSTRNVIRGLHFQLPPADHEKLVYCVAGAVRDVVVDLRRGSPTYGRAALFELSAANATMVYLPRGMAHGFAVSSEEATLVYKVTSVHAPAHDAGVLWSSVDVDWGIDRPVVSLRDQGFPSLSSFDSPFRYEATEIHG